MQEVSRLNLNANLLVQMVRGSEKKQNVVAFAVIIIKI